MSDGAHAYYVLSPQLEARIRAAEMNDPDHWPALEQGITNARVLGARDALSEFQMYHSEYKTYLLRCAAYTHRTGRDNGNMRLSETEFGITKEGELARGSAQNKVAACTQTDVRLYYKSLRTVRWNFDPKVAFHIIAGVAGGGKTTTIKRIYGGYEDAIIITPGKGLRDELRNEGYRVFTYDGAIIHDVKAKTLLFDEYAHEMYGKLLFIFYNSGAQSAVLVGDQLQIPTYSYLPLVHFEHQRCSLSPDLLLSRTYRCPSDIRRLLSKFYSREISGPNDRE